MLEYFIVSLADVYTMILFVYVLMSWIPQKSGTSPISIPFSAGSAILF